MNDIVSLPLLKFLLTAKVSRLQLCKIASGQTIICSN